MKTILASAAMLMLSACHPVFAQEDKSLNPSGTPLYAKPVPCGGMPQLIVEFEKSDMYPLMGLGGYSWLDTGETQASVTIVVVDTTGRFAVVEKNSEQFCLLSTGNVVEYNSEIIKELMEWK